MTLEYWTLVIAIFGALGTLSTWVYRFVVTKKKIGFEIVGSVYSDKLVYMFYILNNKSRLPISINSISICDNKNEIYCEKIPKRLLRKEEKSGSIVKSTTDTFSENFPIAINGLLGHSGYLLFVTEKYDFDKTENTSINIYTNRGKIKIKKIDLNYKDDHFELF